MKTVILIVVTLLTIAFVCLVAGPALTAPSPSPSPTATPTPPASLTTVHAALAKRHRARRARTALIRVRRCFGDSVPVAVAAAPNRAATEAVWAAASARWSWQAKGWRAKYRDGRHAMLKPGGSSNGTRWAPLARWVGWPERAVHTLTGMIMCESSGRERALNTVIDCTGLAQVWPGHVTHRLHLSWSAAIRWLMVGENNLRQALIIWRSQGGRFKPAWAGDPAVEAVE